MGRFDEGIDKLNAQAGNPAAPQGLQQQAQSNADRFSAGTQALQQWGSDSSYAADAQSWYTGANNEGTRNGWDTEFVDKYVSGWDQALKDGTARDYFSRPDATGVVTWDHMSSDTSRTYKFGDVYENGKKVGNVYDQFDRETANLMMLPWMDRDGTQQARLFSDVDTSDPKNPVNAKLDAYITAAHEENNANLEKALKASEFQGDVKDTQKGLQSGAGDELLAGLGGAAGGAVTGASAGAMLTAWTGPGAAVGGAVGAVAGGIAGAVGGLLNKDELSEQAARAYEITKLGFEENGAAAGFATGVKEAAQLSTRFTSPLTNIAHGVTDVVAGDVGDGESARYAVDDKGQSTAPMWSKVADWSAMVGDGLMQFVSPLNRTIYTAQMGGVIAGEVGQMALTGGEMFDPREGGFDNVFVDDHGNFDPVSAAAGIATVGIDAVQLAGWRGLAAASVGRGAAAGAREAEVAGHRFLLDEAGNVTEMKRTIALLAPSEQVASISAARSARVAAMKEAQAGLRSTAAVTADDFYRAANSLANGSNRLKAAMVNALGEGYEESAQALLEPVALDGNLSFADMASAFFYGAAGGLGMSVGATARRPSQDQRLSNQAYLTETIRRGEEPDQAAWDAEWAQLSDSEKRVRAARTPADAALARAALDRIAKDQAATMVASDVDAAKAIDARRAIQERDLKSASERSDAFHVMAGQLDAGRVSETGVLLGDTAHPEAVEASALTIHRLLENRLKGIGLQQQFLTDRVAELEQGDPADPRLAEARAQLATATLAQAFGENLVADVAAHVEAIYDPATTEADAQNYTRRLNQLLQSVYERRAPVSAPDGFTGSQAELEDAAAQFVTLIQSREPKLDTGSYLALLPRASWELTRTRSDNFLQVNTDILQAINGDFDGDKLRAENQLVLTGERYTQARAGQNFGGSGAGLDIAVRNFDAELTAAVGRGLTADPGQLKDEADAVMDAIFTAISNRYAHLMSPEAMARVCEEFRTAVLAGSEEARVTLLDALAREAGEAITSLGRANLSNEWLWASKVVRANFQAFQTTYRQLRAQDGPTDTVDVEDITTPEGVNRRKDRAVTDAQTLALFATGNTLFRKFQKIHYTFFNSSVLGAAGAEQSDLYEMARTYEELGRGVTRAELARVGTDDTVAGRVLVMLSRLVDSAMEDPDLAGRFNPATAMTVLANVKVKDVWWAEGEPTTDGKDLSLAQLLLKRALDADREEHARTFDIDEKLQAKHARLRALTVPNDVNGDVNAERAFVEIFKAVPFADALGGVTGALAPHTTPEQWLRNYISLDANGRQSMERLFTNVPEYLDRKNRSNLPYSFDEASRREVTPYRSMMDALMAVGRASLTFDPAKAPAEAFGGDLAEVSKLAAEDFRAGHEMVRDALANFRRTTNRRAKDRVETAALVQQMLEANPVFGRQVLDLVPDSAANAIYEWRDGRLYVAPWVYEMFAIEDSHEALLHYWKNLTLAQWNAAQLGIHEDDGDAPGRSYHRLQSRFQRLLYRLAKEPGQLHLELVLRKMDESRNLDEFFHWLNSTPGIRGQEAVFLPFNDDVADFEADAGGGWVSIKAGSDLRQAIGKMRRGARQLQQTMSFREEKAATDRVILDGIKRALAGDPAATPLDRDNLRKLRKAVAISRELPRGFAPTAMLALTQGATRSFDAQSHDKGRTATSYGPLGEFQALMDAFAFVPGLERVMETLTAHSIGSLRTNVGDIAKHTGVAMDANGRQIEWEALTVEQAVEMLDDSRTAPLAHALLTPAALDMTPTGLSERLLMEASLKDLLDDSHYKDLFRPTEDGELDQALRYLSLVDAKARAEGGSFDAIRAANDLAIARTSGLGRPATEDDLSRLRNQAYLEVARILKLVGQVQATPETRDSGVLAKLREAALNELRQHRVARALPGFTDPQTGTVVEGWVDQMVAELKAEEQELLNTLADMYDGDELTRQSEALSAQYRRNEERIRGMLDDNLATSTVQRFAVTGDPVVDAAARVQITEYVRSMASFPNRAPEAAEVWSKLAGQLQAGATPDLTTSEWETLSRSAMGVYLVDQVLRVASHVSLPPFPKGDPAISDARFYKYFDPAFSFLVTDLLTEDSPLAAAAVWLHTMAEQPRTVLPIDAMTRTLNRTVLNRNQLGTWTPGLMSQIVEAHQRMDSAAAGQAIAAAGNGPKRQAAIAAATRRTGQVPGPELLTTVSFTGDLLDEDGRFTEIPVQPAGSADATTMPVGMLDNRFFSAIRINGTDVPLNTHNLGFEWAGAEEANPYRYVGLGRLRTVVERMAAQAGVSPADLTLEVEFFHPDSQPPAAMNNAFFEGMSHSLLPDGSESLIATLWSDNGGMISADTQRPLDAGKKGLRAIQPFRRLDAAAIAEAEALWTRDNDFAAMLRRKTELILGYDDGSGTVDPSYYNAVYKHMKLAHIVVGRDADNNPVALTAEEVIAEQAAHGKTDPLNLVGAKLVKLSPDVLRTMLGETGDQGVARFFDDEYLVNPDLVSPYQGITEQMLERFGAGWLAEAGSPADTALANLGQQRALRVRTILTDAERNSRQDRVIYLNNRSAEVRAARYAKLRGADARKGFLATLQLANGSVTAERSTFDFGAVNSGFIAPRNVIEADHTGRLLEALKGATSAESFERGWQVVDEGGPDYPGGVLTLESLAENRDLEHHVVKDDLALVRLDTFERPERDITQVEDRVEKALRYLANSGANIVLGSGNGGGDLRFHASQYLLGLGYAPVAGSKHLYAPVEFVYQTQNERAYESTLAETKLIRPARNVVTFLATDPIGADENVAILNPNSAKLRDRKLLSNIVPSSTFPNYNIPLDDNLDNGLYARTLAHLRTMLDPANTEARDALVAMAGRDPERVMPIRDALDRFHAKLSNRSTLAPEVGEQIEVGDIIPFVHPDGRVLLYRHGFKLPKPEQLPKLLADSGMNIALAKSETEAAATANSGTVRAVENRAGYGRTLQIESPLQPYGDKIQLEWNGMKYVVAPPPQGFTIPQVFRNGTVVDLVSDAASANSKEAFEGRVFGYRNALAFFQYDFTDDLVKFFFPNESTRDPQARVLTVNLLHRLANQDEFRIPFTDANAIAKANVAVADLLAEFAATEAQRSHVPADWLDRLQADTDPSAQIARAMVLYLLTPGAHVDNVLKSAGFSHPRAGDDNVQTRLVPGLFADLLDNGLDSPLHAELIRRFDAQLHRGPNGEGFRLHTDWSVEMFESSRTAPSTPDAAAVREATRLSGGLPLSPGIHSGVDPKILAPFLSHKDTGSYYPGAIASGADIGTVTVHVYHPDSGMKPYIQDGNHRLNSALAAGVPVRVEVVDTQAQAGGASPVAEAWAKVAQSQRTGSSGGSSLRGYLQFGEAHSSGDNPILDGQAYDPNDRQAVSPHNTMAASLSLGAATAHKALQKSTAFAKSFARGGGVSKLATGDSMWQMLTALPNEKDVSFAGWRRETPAETLRRAAAREELVGFYEPLNTDEWSEAERAEYQREAMKVLDRLNLYGTQRAMVDTWVRMHLGRPHAVDEHGTERGVIRASDAIETVKEIRLNVGKGLLPVAGANVPLIDVNHLTTIYLANLNRPDGKAWAPRTTLEANSPVANSWDAWVDTAFGTAWDGDPEFDQVYLLAVDGLMHGYQGATTSTRYLPVSSDILRQRLLMDEKTNQMLVSISADENLLATDPTLFNTSRAELDEIIGGQRIYAPGRDGADPASAKGRQKARLERWRREVDAPRQVGKRARGVRGPGQTFVGHTTTTSAFFRSMINLRAGNTLFNVALVVSAPFEAFYRRTINTFANVAVGESTGAIGQAQARLAERFKDTSIGKVAEALGLTPTYTADQLSRLNTLVDALSSRTEFKAMVYKELMFQYPTMPGIGRVEKALEKYAKFGGRLQDPAWGMLPKDLARIYVETVMRKVAQDPTSENLYSVERLLTEMARNPQWVQHQDLEAHNMAIAAISQIRSLKPNVLSLAFRGVVEPLSENDKFLVNATGNMLKVLTLFQNFWSNFGTTITGLQGAADFAAFWFDGREKKITARAQAALRGEKYNPAEPDYFDMSEVLESLDLADSFIRGGVTHAALFAFGMAAGGLGLSGDDDEMKWRRRQAELQGVPVLRDPRDIENDFRNKDTIFLDWLPFGMDSWFRVNPADPNSRSLAQMNWILRTFLSPIIGFERFYENGDFSEVIHGFKDAIGSHPIVNDQLWNAASDTAASLHEQANAAVEAGDPVAGGHFLTTAVGVLERMLLENSMVNMLYIGFDEWDRDPYVLPLRDSDGQLQRDIAGNARPNDLAMESYVDPATGKVGTGYLGRSDRSTAAHVLTENRATLGFISALFTGGVGDSDYWRYNMPIKVRSIDKPAMTVEDAKAVVLDAYGDTGGQPNLSADELAQLWKNQAKASGIYVDWGKVDQAAAAAVKRGAYGTDAPALLSEVRDGREHLTADGARAVFQGLAKGSVKIGDAALAGVYIPFEMREQIQKEWIADIIQEGVDMGLDQTKATSRMKRIWYGPMDDPAAKGLGDILWDKNISYSDTVRFKQLNTTYAIGPDGMPWATGFGRDKLMGALGLAPLKAPIRPEGTATSVDSRLNTVDQVAGMNTGLRALVPLDDSEYVPTDVEIGKAIEKAIADAAKQDFAPLPAFAKSGGGYGGYGGYRRRSYGGGYGGGGGGGGYFTKMYSLPDNVSPYGNNASFINTSNPIIRRAFIRRERVWSERGRLNQWQ